MTDPTTFPKEVVEAVARAICQEVDFQSPDDQVPYNDMFGGGMMPRWQRYATPAIRALAAIPTAGFLLAPADMIAKKPAAPFDELWEAQKLLRNVRGWLSRGASEHSMDQIDAYWAGWRERCEAARAILSQQETGQ